MKSVVSEKGQVTIPKALREQLGIRPGQVLELSEEAGRLVATKASGADAIDSLYGILSGGPTTDTLLALMRGKPDTA